MLEGPAAVLVGVVAGGGAKELRFAVGAEDTGVDDEVETMTSCKEVISSV